MALLGPMSSWARNSESELDEELLPVETERAMTKWARNALSVMLAIASGYHTAVLGIQALEAITISFEEEMSTSQRSNTCRSVPSSRRKFYQSAQCSYIEKCLLAKSPFIRQQCQSMPPACEYFSCVSPYSLATALLAEEGVGPCQGVFKK